MMESKGCGVLDTRRSLSSGGRPVGGYDASGEAAQCTKLQFNTRLLSGLSSENVGTSISNRSPLSLTIW